VFKHISGYFRIHEHTNLKSDIPYFS